MALLFVTPVLLVLRLLPAITVGAAAPILLLTVLLIARAWGTGPALLASVCAALGFSYYFLPPVGFGIEDPNDWVAFVTFTVTAVVVGELAAQAEQRRLEAQEGKREIERLYRQLEEAFERASEAEAARRNEQLKAALLDALTHNLRTPLTAIKAAVTALIGPRSPEAHGGLSQESRAELLLVIDEESDRLNRFIEGLSAAERPGVSGPRSHGGVRLEQIVRDALTRADTVTRHHQIRLDLDPALPLLAVDAAAVTEVVYTLLDNASKYAVAGTTITLKAILSDQRDARVEVVDEGPGIPAAFREQVFEKFFQVPGREALDPRRKGVGLGLPIARRLVEAQGGRIWVEMPASGVGTAVVLMLPAVVDVEQGRGEELVTAGRP
jgi:two-component system sensor histidine kinase KdpD